MIICAPVSPARSIASRVSRSASARVASSGEQNAPLPKRGSRWRPARDAVDPVPVERVSDLVEVRRRQLLRVVELVVVDQVAEPLDRGPHLLRRRLARELGLVPGSVEAGRHVAEGPDSE
jgi:hypothetical protein